MVIRYHLKGNRQFDEELTIQLESEAKMGCSSQIVLKNACELVKPRAAFAPHEGAVTMVHYLRFQAVETLIDVFENDVRPNGIHDGDL
jgi:hypothetical protein